MKSRKGFTLVELLVVIAILAILATATIVGFTAFTKKAQVSNDSELVAQLNKYAQAASVSKDFKTVTEMREELIESGFELANIKLEAEKHGYVIGFDIEKDRFVLLKGGKAADGYTVDNPLNVFAFVKTEAEAALYGSTVNKFSLYLQKGFTATEGALAVTTGVDVGENTDITSISYTNTSSTPQSVVIRSNGLDTVLTVNAPLDTVHHYDYLDELTITAVAPNSYHEHGTVKNKATISQGHIVVESGSKVPQIEVKAATGIARVTANESTLVIVDEASKSQTSIIANSSAVYVTGVSAEQITGSQASTVELPTVITTEAEFSAAITAKKGFIQLGADFEASSAHVIDFKTLIDFAGFKITSSLMSSAFITNTSILTFADSASNGGIISQNNNIVINSGTLTINGGKFVGNREYTIDEALAEGLATRGVIHNNSSATMVINNIELYTKTDFGILNYGKATINNGSFTSDSEASGNRRYSYCVSSYQGSIVINNAIIYGIHGGIGINGGKGTINNAEVIMDKTKNSYYAIYIAGEIGVVEATINGGTFNPGKTGKCLYVGNQSDGGLGRTAMATVNGGQFSGGIYASFSESSNYGLGILKVNGGTFAFDPSSYLSEGHTVNQEGNTWIVR